MPFKVPHEGVLAEIEPPLMARLKKWFRGEPAYRLRRLVVGMHCAHHFAVATPSADGLMGYLGRVGYGRCRLLLYAPAGVPLCFFYLRLRLYYLPREEDNSAAGAPEWWKRAWDEEDFFVRLARQAARSSLWPEEQITTAAALFALWRSTRGV